MPAARDTSVPARCATPGLSSAEAATRLAAEGENRLAEARSPSVLSLLARQFRSLMIGVLLGAVAVSLFLGDWAEAAGIAAIVVLNASVSALQEWKAESALRALRAMAAPRTTVVRDGRPVVLPTSEVVRGDLLLLEAGDVVGADGRLVEAANLETNEAVLTGESLPVSKRLVAPRADAASIGAVPEDRAGLVFAGTSVTRGQGRALVTATGMATEFGRVAGLLRQADAGTTPLQRRLDRVSRRLLVLCAGIVVILFALGLARGERVADLLLAALSLAVATVPEGLPTVVTLALAVGVQRMARRRALVRHLAAVETLGTAQVIASDKTGTLTTGQLRVRALWMLEDAASVRIRLRHAAAACNDADVRPGEDGPVLVGDPTEGALLLDAAADGWNRPDIEIAEPRLLVVPFESERKRMAIARRTAKGIVVYVKGAPEVVLPACSDVLRETGPSPLDADARARVLEATHRMAAGGLRVLAFALRPLPAFAAHAPDPHDLERDLTFLGLAGLADTPRPEARDAVARCADAGIRVVMITGDHPVTAAAIARELGILPEGVPGPSAVLDGRALDALDEEALAAATERTVVYARVTPAHKLRLVRALKRSGRIVAMTGDGVNDAPAIREASVGIAMGRTGTEVSRQAADIVVTDDNFATIVNAVEEGRRIFDNIQRALLYLLAGNLGEVLVMLVAGLAGWPVPLLPVHLLWVNFVTDGFPALALATERVHPDALRRPPRSADAEFADPPFLRRMALAGSLIALVSLCGFGIGYRDGDPAAARALGFAVLVTSHVTWAFAARSRSTTHFGLGMFSNMRLLVILGATLGLQILLQSHAATAALFGLPVLSPRGWIAAVAIGLVPVTVIELSKLSLRRRDGPR